jgi:hypothetical protein
MSGGALALQSLFCDSPLVMEAIELTVQVHPDGTLEWPDSLPELVPGEAEVIVLSRTENSSTEESPLRRRSSDLLATNWPRLDAGQWKTGALRREHLYGKMGR